MSTLDQINSMNASKAVQVAYFIASQLQDFTPAQQAAGAALFLNELCEQVPLDARAVLNKSARMAKDADTFYQREVKALRDYIKGELR